MATVEDQDKISIITKRNIERKLNIQKNKDLKELNTAENERIGYFEQEFSSSYAEIEELLNDSYNQHVNNLREHFNTIFKKILILQKYVAASNIFLRTYDIKKCNELLNYLTVKSRDVEDELLPKKKFGFKNKSRLTNAKDETTDVSKDVTDSLNVSKKVVFDDNHTGFSDKCNENLSLEGEEILKRNITLDHMINCRVKIYGSPSTLHMHSLNNCTILCGPVSTSVFASNCENCTFIIACQQLRLHTSNNIKIYLHVTSRAIMEDCTSIEVAPYQLKYDNIHKDFEQAGLDVSYNNWQCIDDFNWLNSTQPSPNWKILDEKERVSDWK